MSHVVTTAIEFKDEEALAAAVRAMGGVVIGHGTHRLYGGNEETGFGFHLKNWSYPCILQGASLKFDNYNGAWGSESDLVVLKGYYAVEVAAAVCEELMWQCEREANGTLIVWHPDGGSITVSADGTVDANGFIGHGCEAAVEAIASAIGTKTAAFCKPIANAIPVQAHVQER